MILSIPPGFHCNAFLRVLIEKILFLVLSVEREKISLFTPELRKCKQFSARVDFGKILTLGNGTNAATNQTENGFKMAYINFISQNLVLEYFLSRHQVSEYFMSWNLA